MADDKFFEEEQTTDEQKFTIGGKEYSQDELEKVVGLGEIGRELEEKWKTPIDRVYPEYTKSRQALSDREREIEELKSKVTQPQTQTQQNYEQLSEDQKQMVRKQLNDLGYGEEAFRNIVREEMAANQLIADVNSVISEAGQNGQPTTDAETLLRHMSETGIKNPSKAYKDMFEAELDAIKEKKISEIKPSGMVTTTSSSAGGKQPTPVTITKANLQSLVSQALGGE